MFVEFTGEKLVREAFCSPPASILKRVIGRCAVYWIKMEKQNTDIGIARGFLINKRLFKVSATLKSMPISVSDKLNLFYLEFVYNTVQLEVLKF